MGIGAELLKKTMDFWPPDLPDLVNYNYVITFLFEYLAMS